MMSACQTRSEASSRRPPPSARAIDDEMPPPIAPAEIICISITPGNTIDMPASASVPSLPTKYVSIRPVADWASISMIFGAASRSSSGSNGASSSARVRPSIAGFGNPTDRSVITVALMTNASRQDQGKHDGFEPQQGGGVAVHLGAQDRALERVDQEGGDGVGIEAG